MALLFLIPLSFSLYESLAGNAYKSQVNLNEEKSIQKNISKENEEAVQQLIQNGLDLYRQGLYDSCIQVNLQALQIQRNNDIAWNNIAASYGALGKYKEEVEACNQALSINPANEMAKNNRAWAESQLMGK